MRTCLVITGLLAAFLAVSASAETILTQGFEFPFDQTATNPVNGTDDSADKGGVWSSVGGYNSTYSGWGDGGSGMNLQGGGIVVADLGQTLSNGIATVTVRLATDFRMGAFGGRADFSLDSIDPEKGGNSSAMAFGFAGHWGSSNQISAYNLDPGSFYGSEYIDLAKTRPAFGNVTFTLDFGAGTYDVLWDAVFNDGIDPITWTGLTLGGSAFRYLVFESVGSSDTYYDSILVEHTPGAELILVQDFGLPFEQGANSTIEADGPIDDSASNGGIWNGARGYSSTYSGWGDGGPGMHNGGKGLVIADMGQDLSSGIVTVTVRQATDYRMGAFGGRADYSLDSFVPDNGGDAGGMLFGYAGHWSGTSGMSVYDLEPSSLSGFWGGAYLDIAKTRPTFGDVVFTLDFDIATYDVVWDPVFNDGVNPVTWSGLPLNGSSFRYLVWESVGASEMYFDKVTVKREPSVLDQRIVMFTDFAHPPFGGGPDPDSGDPVNGINADPNGQGIWYANSDRNSATAGSGFSYAATHALWGFSGPGLSIYGGTGDPAGAVVRADIGEMLDSRTVEVSFQSKREFRGGVFGGYETAETAWDDSKALFGIRCNSDDTWAYLENGQWVETASLIPSKLGWAKYTVTIDFDADSYGFYVKDHGYSVKVFEAGLNSNASYDALQYLMWFCENTNAEIKVDNVRVLQRNSIPVAAPEVVDASTFAYDPNDSTEALQDAIDTGAATVYVPDMGTPWSIRPVYLRAPGQTIVFEDGVVVAARPGAPFDGVNFTCLLNISACDGITILGNGATMRMNRPYAAGEWRHAIKVLNCSNITIEGLTLKDSGGDGVYLGGTDNSNIILRNLICDNIWRNAISVISADGLLIEGCKLYNTNGNAPEAGIDFEVNGATYTIDNAVIRNCRIASNADRGIFLAALTNGGVGVDLSIENCTIYGNGQAGIEIWQIPQNLTIKDCIIVDNGQWGVDSPGGMPSNLVKNCVINGNGLGTSNQPAIIDATCVTDTAPAFASSTFGASDYLYLTPANPAAITAGASDNGVIGFRPQCGDVDNPYPPGDLYGDCVINLADFAVQAGVWMDQCSAPYWCNEADIDRSGTVGPVDLNALAGYWLDEVDLPAPY